MSLVICSNLIEDKREALQDQSVNEAFSFRNELSSTLKIPANSQVAVQSVKVNVDGRIVVGKDNGNFYQYFGDKIDEPAGETLEEKTSKPVIVRIADGDKVLELSKTDLAVEMQRAIRRASYHPNQKNQATVENEPAAGEGFTITYDSNNASASNVPTAMEYYGNTSARDPSTAFIYGATPGVFQRNLGTNTIDLCTGIARQDPMSTVNGSLTINISSANANANASGVPWLVGLSRSVNQQGTKNPLYTPPYWGASKNNTGFINARTGGGAGFLDFACARNDAGELVLFHSLCNASNNNKLSHYEVEYWNNTNSSFTGAGRFDLNGSGADVYTRVRFKIAGERVSCHLYNSSTTSYELVTEYASLQNANTYFKPVNQACWCLHPVLSVGSTPGNLSCTLEFEDYTGLTITGYDATDGVNGGWYETMEYVGATNECLEVESRAWGVSQTMVATNYAQIGLNASSTGPEYDHVLILASNRIYNGTQGANARRLLGYENSLIDDPVITPGKPAQAKFHSDNDPDITTTQALFVRLNNFGQKVLNARMGNRSNIICHLPRFDNSFSTGRLHFEPNNLMYLDLNNPYELNVNEFDISFCYINEQYARTLTGQSIVALHFREKPKM